MNRIRNFLTGSTNYPDEDDNNMTTYPSSSSYGGRNTRRYNSDELYLSDDEDLDWGMSAQPSSERRSSSAFWDQTTTDMNMSNIRGLQEWEREAMSRDAHEEDDGIGIGVGVGGSQQQQYEIGNDDYCHSDQRPPPPPTHHNIPHVGHDDDDDDDYDDVHEDIRSLEETEIDNASSASSSNKDQEVANAYRDYLRSIRDGGFESYLDNDTTGGGAEENFDTNINTNTTRGEDEALERVLDIEEERSSSYGNLYGIQDVRSGSAATGSYSLSSSTSPYSIWRAKAKALLRQEEEREQAAQRVGGSRSSRGDGGMLSPPSQNILDKFRRKRSRDGGVGKSSPSQQQSNGYFDDRMMMRNDLHQQQKDHNESYIMSLLQNPRIRGICFGICLIVAFTAGLSYYGGKSNNSTDGDDEKVTPDMEAIPPPPSVGQVDDTTQKNDGGLNAMIPDAIKNSLGTFDPVWFDRKSGWNGITYNDSEVFCATHDNRVPCPYEIYCNEGKDGDLYRGIRPNGEQWSAIGLTENQWVQVGGMFTCHLYTDLNEEKKPAWGITGVSREHEHGAGGITQNIMCCRDVGKHGIDLDHVDGDSPKDTTNSEKKNPNNGNVAESQSQDLEIQKREKAVIAAFKPIWFSTAHGWNGGTYEDAILFCESMGFMVLCPYAAYCPNGRFKSPLPGSMMTTDDGEEWCAANGPMNTWVQIGMIDGDPDTKCTLHHEILGERPQFGVDGSRKDVKHHIMCCQM